MSDWGNIGHRGCGLDIRTVCLLCERDVNAKRIICCTAHAAHQSKCKQSMVDRAGETKPGAGPDQFCTSTKSVGRLSIALVPVIKTIYLPSCCAAMPTAGEEQNVVC